MSAFLLTVLLALPAAAAPAVCDRGSAERYTMLPCANASCDYERAHVLELEAHCLKLAKTLEAAFDPAHLELKDLADNLDRLLLAARTGSYGYKASFDARLPARLRAAAAAVERLDAACPHGLVRRREPVVCADDDPPLCAGYLMAFQTACMERYAAAIKAWSAGGVPPVKELEAVLDNAIELKQASRRRSGVYYQLDEARVEAMLKSARDGARGPAAGAAPVAAAAAAPPDPLQAAGAPPPATPRRSPGRGAVPFIAGAVALFGISGWLFARAGREEASVKDSASIAYVPVARRGERPERLKGLETLVEAYAARGPFEPAFVRRVMSQACALVGAVHALGRGHGGVHPESLCFDKDAVLMLLPPGPSVPAGCAAPEGAVSPAGDVFSLGCVAYFLLVGRTPFDDEKSKAAGEFISASNRRTTLPLSVDLFFKKALAPEPSARHADAAELRAAFEKALPDRAI